MTSPSMKAATVVVAAATMVGLAGCKSESKQPSPLGTSPISAPRQTSASASPTPTLSEHEQLVQEAIARYTRIQEVHFALAKAGGLGPDQAVPKELSDLVEGEPLKSYVGVLRQFNQKKIRVISGEPRVWQGKEASKAPTTGARVSITACMDGSRIKSVVGASEKPSNGQALRTTAAFKERDGRLVLFFADENVDPSCVVR